MFSTHVNSPSQQAGFIWMDEWEDGSNNDLACFATAEEVSDIRAVWCDEMWPCLHPSPGIITLFRTTQSPSSPTIFPLYLYLLSLSLYPLHTSLHSTILYLCYLRTGPSSLYLSSISLSSLSLSLLSNSISSLFDLPFLYTSSLFLSSLSLISTPPLLPLFMFCCCE